MTEESGKRGSPNPAENVQMVKGIKVLARLMQGADRALLGTTIEVLRKKPGMSSGVIVLGCEVNGEVTLIASVSEDLTDRLDAAKISSELLEAIPAIIKKML